MKIHMYPKDGNNLSNKLGCGFCVWMWILKSINYDPWCLGVYDLTGGTEKTMQEAVEPQAVIKAETRFPKGL